MAESKGGLSYFAEGDTTGTPSSETETTAQPQAKTPASYITVGKNKIAMPSYGGTAAVDTSTLENMQKLLAERQAQKDSFLETLKDMKAWTPGPRSDQMQALQGRGEERARQAADIFSIQNYIAQTKAQQQAQADFEKRRARDLGVGQTGGAGGAGSAGVGGPSPFAMTDEIKNALANAKTEGEYNKIYNTWAQKMSESKTNPEWSKLVDVKVWTGKEWKIDKRPLSEAYAYASSNSSAAQANPGIVNAGAALGGGGDITAKNIGYVESNNTPGAVGPNVPGQGTAKSSMQVMDATALNPGFGVKPANITGDAANDEAERKRVGTEYFGALKSRYQDPSLAAAAYVWGPGNVDTWIKNGAKIEDVPADVRDYVAKTHLSRTIIGAPNSLANAGQKRETASTTAPKGSVPTMGELEVESKVKENLAVEEAKKSGETLATEGDAARKNWLAADTRINDVNTAQTLVNQYPTMFGRLVKPGVISMAGTGLKEGVKIGSHGQLALPSIEEMSAQMAKGATGESLAARRQVAQLLHKVELDLSSLLKGQGSVSDAERRILAGVAGSVSDPATLLNKKLDLLRMHAEYDKEMGDAYRKSGVPWSQFIKSDDYVGVVNNYNKKLQQNFKNEYANGRDIPVSGPGASTTSSGQWRVKRD